MPFCHECGYGNENGDALRIEHRDQFFPFDKMFCPTCTCMRYVVDVKGDTKKLYAAMEKAKIKHEASSIHRGEVMRGNWEKWKKEKEATEQ